MSVELECGCKLDAGYYANVVKIIYCPVHKAAPAILKTLEAVEWCMGYCLWCMALPEDGHYDDCERQIGIAIAKDED